MATNKTDNRRQANRATRKKAAKTAPKRTGPAALGECFVIMPLDKDRSPIRDKAMGLLDSVIKPALSDIGFTAIGPLELEKPGSISTQVIERLLSAPLIVANLTEKNANVMYELAVRHAKRLPVVCMAEEGTSIPFDVLGERYIPYQDNLNGVIVARERLKIEALAALREKKPDNPIYRATDALLIRDSRLPPFQKKVLSMLSLALGKTTSSQSITSRTRIGSDTSTASEAFRELTATVRGSDQALETLSRLLFGTGIVERISGKRLPESPDGTPRQELVILATEGSRLTGSMFRSLARTAGVVSEYYTMHSDLG